MGRVRVERVVDSIVVIVIIFIFIAKAVLMTELRRATFLPIRDQRRYFLLYHFSNFKWFPISNLQFFHHLQGNFSCSIIENVKGEVYVSSLTCVI